MNLSIANQGYWCEGWKIWITLLHFIWDICELSFPLESKRNICLINLFYCLVMLLSNADIDIRMVIPSKQSLSLFLYPHQNQLILACFSFPSSPNLTPTETHTLSTSTSINLILNPDISTSVFKPDIFTKKIISYLSLS